MTNPIFRTNFAKQLEERTLVVDTSVLLAAGTALLSSLPPCQVVLPSVVVKELEGKRSHPTLGFLAREWLNLLEELRKTFGEALQRGVPAGPHGDIIISVEPNHSSQGVLPKHLQDGSHDSTILAVAYSLSQEQEVTVPPVLLLSNDTPLRLHATLDLKLDACEFNALELLGTKTFDGGLRVKLTPDAYAEAVQNDRLPALVEASVKKAEPSRANFFTTTSLTTTDEQLEQRLFLRGKPSQELKGSLRVGSITTRTVEQHVAACYLMAPAEELSVVSLNGSAGTGKTLLSIAAALKSLEEERYQKVIVFRSLHEMGRGQELGFLPGTVEEKMEAWAGAVYDALDVIALHKLQRNSKGTNSKPGREEMKKQVALLRSQVEVAPITYLRGRSLSNSFIILDEAQNFSRNELLNILSRAGEGTKMVLCSDDAQVDNKYLQPGSKADVWSLVEDFKDEESFAHVSLKTTERSKLAEMAARLLEG